MTGWVLLVAAALFGAATGALVPRLIRAVPEHGQPDVPSYRQVASRSGLWWQASLAGAAIAAALAWAVGWRGELALLLPVVPVGIALSVVDWRTRLLPKWLVLPTTAYVVVAGGVVALVAGAPGDWIRGAVGLLAARSAFWVLWRLRSASMGFGDVRVAALLGFVLGYLGVGELIAGLYAAFLLFVVPGVTLALWRRDRSVLKAAYPFGPFLFLGALLGVLVGDPAWHALT